MSHCPSGTRAAGDEPASHRRADVTLPLRDKGRTSPDSESPLTSRHPDKLSKGIADDFWPGSLDSQLPVSNNFLLKDQAGSSKLLLMQNIKVLPAGPAIPVRALILTAIILSYACTSKVAAEDVIPAVQDAFVMGGELAGEIMPHDQLQVAARSLYGMHNVRKTFLQFHVDETSIRHAISARVVLILREDAVISLDGDPLQPVELVLSGAPDAEWDENFLTWETASNHDQQCATDDGNPNLEVLAVATLDPTAANEDEKVTFSDPRLLEFLRKHRGDVTFVVTSVSPPNFPGFTFFSKEGTGRPERRPVIILETE